MTRLFMSAVFLVMLASVCYASPAGFARLVNHYVEIGEAATLREFEEGDLRHKYALAFSDMCIVLWQPPSGVKISRRPMLGAPVNFDLVPSALESVLDSGEWPDFPLVQSGSSYFNVAGGYDLDGVAESADDFWGRCRKNAVFRRQPLPIPTSEEEQKDALMLRQSPTWKRVFSLPLSAKSVFGKPDEPTWGVIGQQLVSPK